MARKTRTGKVHPSLMAGAPQHGDVFPDDEDELEEQEAENDDENEEEDDAPASRSAPDLDTITELARLKAENEVLRRNHNPPPKADEPEDVDWDDLLFTNPKEALRLHGEQIRKQVTSELRGEYQRDQGTEKFWKDFYDTHKDLKGDKKMVDFVLSDHMSELADLPVEKAMSRLADLTRDLIMGYQKRTGPGKRNRATVEGNSLPSTTVVPKREPRPTTLSDILKARKIARRKGATAA